MYKKVEKFYRKKDILSRVFPIGIIFLARGKFFGNNRLYFLL